MGPTLTLKAAHGFSKNDSIQSPEIFAKTSLLSSHMTMSNSGKMDLVCGRGWGAQRMYSAGNEREVSRINAGGLKYGLQVGKRDQYSMLFELMNQNAQNIRVYVTQVSMSS